MSSLQVLDLIVRPVLADSLGMNKKEECDIWSTCLLKEDLGVTEPEDWKDLAWRLSHKLQKYDQSLTISAQELEKPRVTVADVLLLVRCKLDEAEVFAPMIVGFVKSS